MSARRPDRETKAKNCPPKNTSELGEFLDHFDQNKKKAKIEMMQDVIKKLEESLDLLAHDVHSKYTMDHQNFKNINSLIEKEENIAIKCKLLQLRLKYKADVNKNLNDIVGRIENSFLDVANELLASLEEELKNSEEEAVEKTQ